MAIFDDGRYDQLLYLNRSNTQVRAGYRTAFFEVLDEEERSHVKAIALQRWNGAPDSGRWVHARLAWGWRSKSGSFVVGLEFLNCANFWELDWNEPPGISAGIADSQSLAALHDVPKNSAQ